VRSEEQPMNLHASPEWIWAVLIAVLLVAIIYGVVKTSRRRRIEQQITDEGTKQVYRKEDRAEKGLPQ